MDRAEEYAHAVETGEVAAGNVVRLNCARFLRELQGDTPHRRWRYDPKQAAAAMLFFEKVLCLPGDFDHEPFRLLDWEAYIVGNLFGWVDVDDPQTRRYRLAYFETGKGSGKTPLVAGILAKLIWGDGRRHARFAIAGATHEQGVIAMTAMVQMCRASAAIKPRMEVHGNRKPYLIWDKITDNQCRVLAFKQEAKGVVSGEILSGGSIEEYHEHLTDKMFNFVDASKKIAKNPLLMIPTNAGGNIDATPCGELHKKLVEAEEQGGDDLERQFHYITQMDALDDPVHDRTCWIKTNPSLPHTPSYDYIQEQLDNSKGLPAKRSDVLRLVFCQWNQHIQSFLTAGLWEKAQTDQRPTDLKDRELFMALDLSRRDDFTACGFIWRPDPNVPGQPYWYDYTVWMPESRLEAAKLENRYFEQWHEDGWLNVVPGDFIDYGYVARYVADFKTDYNLAMMAYDPYRIREFKRACSEIDIHLVDHQSASRDEANVIPLITHWQNSGGGAKSHVEGKGLSMPRSIEKMEELFFNNHIQMRESPLLNWCARAAKTKSDGLQNRCFIREGEGTAKVDPIVTMVMAIGAARYGQDENTLAKVWANIGREVA